MPFRAPGADEYGESQFKPAAEDSYRVLIDSYKILTYGTDIPVGNWNKEGETQVRFFLTPQEIDGDPEAELLDVEENPLAEGKYFVFFFDPQRLGVKPRLARSRKFLASALGVPVDQPVEYDSLQEMCEDMVGREVVVDVTVNGQNNKVEDVRPVRRRRQRQEKGDLTEVAAKVFDEEDEF